MISKSKIIKTDNNAIVLDLSVGARICGKKIKDVGLEELCDLINNAMKLSGTCFAFGRWGEPREFYISEDFLNIDKNEMRTIHLGIDVFCLAGTSVYAPMSGKVIHIGNNNKELDYGPVMILEHFSDHKTFYTLYGHLSEETLNWVDIGKLFRPGDKIAEVGGPPSNGNWPPHLHFQVINDLLELGLNFPGVALDSEKFFWFDLSPSPASFFPEVSANKLIYI